MTPEDRRRVAEGAIRFGPYERPEAAQAIASTLRLDAMEVEGVLDELQNKHILEIVGTSRNVNKGKRGLEDGIQFAKGLNWPDDWKDFPLENLGLRL
jgi:hypothetical protein